MSSYLLLWLWLWAVELLRNELHSRINVQLWFLSSLWNLLRWALCLGLGGRSKCLIFYWDQLTCKHTKEIDAAT